MSTLKYTLFACAAVALLTGCKTDSNIRPSSYGAQSVRYDANHQKGLCERELYSRMKQDLGAVSNLNLSNLESLPQQLTGGGEVSVPGGGGREFTFKCQFDSSGKLIDAHYKNIGGMGDEVTRINTSVEFKQGYNDGYKGHQPNPDHHNQDYKEGFMSGQKARGGR